MSSPETPLAEVKSSKRLRRRRIPRLTLGTLRRERSKGDQNPLIATYRRPAPSIWLKIGAYLTLGVFCAFYGILFARLAPHLMLPFLVPPAVVLILGIWALPSGEYAPTGALPWLFMGFFAARVLWPNYLALVLPGLPWISFLRLFGAPMSLALLVCISVSDRFRRDVAEVITADPLIWRIMLLFLSIQIMSIGFSTSPGQSINKLVTELMNWVAVFVCGCYLFRKPGMLSRWVFVLFSSGYLLCVLGVLEARNHGVLWAGHLPTFLKMDDEAVNLIVAGSFRAAAGIHRVMVTQTTPLGLAEYFGITMPFALHYIVERYHPLLRLAAFIYIPTAFGVILLTDSRLGVVATLVSLLAFLLIWGVRHWRRRPSSLVGPAIVMAYPVIFGMGVGAVLVFGKLRNMVLGGGAAQASTESRREQWAMGWPKILNHPLGHGIGRGGATLGFYVNGTLTIDSYYLGLLLEYGIIGYLIYMALFLSGAFALGKASIDAAEDREILLMMPISVAILGIVIVKGVFSQDDNDPLLFMMMAGGLAMIHRARLGSGPAADKRLRAPFSARVARGGAR